MEKASNDQLKKFKDLVEDIRICMMLTTSADGELNSRPMSTSKVDEDGTLWFFTNEFSPKAKEISKNNRVYLTYSSPSKNEYLGLEGDASLVDDRKLMDELWNPSMKAWFPGGKDDPAIILIKVVPDGADYWEGPSNKLRFVIGVAKALLTGQQYKDGEHGHLNV